jgi:TonB family protein
VEAAHWGSSTVVAVFENKRGRKMEKINKNANLVFIRLAGIALLLIACGSRQVVAAQSTQLPEGVAQDWKPLATDDKDFTISMPEKVTIHRRGEYRTESATVKESYEVGAFYKGCAMVVRIFHTNEPKAILSLETRYSYFRDAKRSSIKINGIDAVSFVGQRNDSHFEAIGFVRNGRLYLIHAGARKAENSYLKYFLDSINIKGMTNPPPNAASVSVKPQSTLTPVAEEGEPEPATASLKPIIFYVAKATYTDRARQNRRQGTITVSAIFSAQGEVTGVKILKGLPDGLNDEAISAAQRIRFLPAEKDGKPVSVRMSMEFSFNLI